MNINEIKTAIIQGGFSLAELNSIADIVGEAKVLGAKATIEVGSRVYVVQKTKRTLGTVEKVNIKKAIVELDSPAFKLFSERRSIWAENDSFSSPGPRQYWGPISKRLPLSTTLNEGYDNLNFSFGN